MPAIHSPSNPDNFTAEDGPTNTPHYSHGADVRRSFIPMAFQVTSPLDLRRALLPHALVMHVNPSSFSENSTKKKTTIQTRGGWVEQHWGDEMTDISADGTTGAFLNIFTGLASVVRQQTIAWDRYRDLQDLFRNNGSVFDPMGNVVLQGRIMLMYDRNVYIGFFKTFGVEETDDAPFLFKLSWSFKVTQTIMLIPYSTTQQVSGPKFQSQNTSSPTRQTNINQVSTPLESDTFDQTHNLPSGSVGII